MDEVKKDQNLVDENAEGDSNEENEVYTAEIKEIVMRAVQEPEFREQLAADADTALAEYNLTEFQKILITTLDKDDLEKLTPENLEEYFSADSAVYTPDIESEIIAEEADEEDI